MLCAARRLLRRMLCAARRLLRQSELRRMATERDAKHSSIAELEEVLCVKPRILFYEPNSIRTHLMGMPQ